MAILTFKDLSKEFGGDYIFKYLSGKVEDDSSIGLVGPNGIGKTTLLRLLAGRLEDSGGEVTCRKDLKTGYLQQEALEAFAHRDNTVFNEMKTVFSHLDVQQRELNRLEEALGNNGNNEELLEEYGRCLESFEKAGGYDWELKIKKTLEGLGFSKDQWDMPLTHCSGGEKTRVLLGRLLLEEPDLLILDEPTNHLDMKAVEWLEGILIRWEKALVVVSHDRYFLDSVSREIWEMNSYGIETFKGNYSAYAMQRQERRERREKTFNATVEFFFKELNYVRRFIDKKTTQAKGRLKRLVRHVKAVEIGGPEALEMKWNEFCLESGGVSSTKWSVNETEAHIRALRVKNPYTKPMNMRIRCTEHLPDKVLAAENLKIGYGDNVLFSLDKADLYKGERAALLGPNGCGKSTFLKVLLGEIAPLEGVLDLKEAIRPAYFAQAHDLLNPENTAVEEIMACGKGMLEAEARSYLGRYLFSGEDAFKKVDVLSGGERGRLTLAVLALEEVNFLILDEPTNHLDIQSREILEEALLHFPGPILFVTHDRYLVEKLANRIWQIEKGKLITFKGSYGEFLSSREESRPEEKKPPRTKVRLNSQSHEKEMRNTEEKMVSLEEEMAFLENKLENAVAGNEQDRIKEWKESYLRAKEEMDELWDKWEILSVS